MSTQPYTREQCAEMLAKGSEIVYDPDYPVWPWRVAIKPYGIGAFGHSKKDAMETAISVLQDYLNNTFCKVREG